MASVPRDRFVPEADERSDAICRMPAEELARLLNAAKAKPGHRILVTGPGLGYTAALLCQRYGSEQVTVTGAEAKAVRRVRDRLARAGYRPSGRISPPYQRIIVAAPLRGLRIPAESLARCEPGGKILAVSGTGIAVLVTVTDERHGTGRFPWPVYLQPTFTTENETPDPMHPERSTAVRATECDHGAPAGFRLHVQLTIGEIGYRTWGWSGGVSCSSFRHVDGSWANVNTGGDGGWTVVEGGPRRLWTEVEAEYARWQGLGSPDIGRYRLVIAGGRHIVRLDAENSWELPG
ncbi:MULTISPECIES: hypothetical protein [unclassified Crossiella]|uniref:hypothetical protein n=1 Tax=unclassified Crossiella TaxID=2620835 RepID=UPI001FFF04C1|nr:MULTISPECIES: hypothetical protein [unclassified Crossiella]MCK2237336.1 hypothetical protein [Crossiella sp. S99.2]MCK2250991.1 hypothetical protein [Crossiella sp. S99.1]